MNIYIDIKKDLEEHKKWLNSKGTKGSRGNLSHLNLSGCDLRNALLEKADLSGTNLTRADMKKAILSEATLIGTILRSADLYYANISNTNIVEVDFTFANLWGTDFSHSTLSEKTNLNGARLMYTRFINTDLRDMDLRNVDLRNSNLMGTIGNGTEIVTFQTPYYICNFTKNFLQIGCEEHSYEEWWGFSDDEILEMDPVNAQKFWNKYKSILQEIRRTLWDY